MISGLSLAQKLVAELIGTAGLLAVVVGSGIMGQSLSQGNDALALLANAIATGAGLYALIQTFGPISGAHFNPVVSLIEMFWKKLSPRDALAYALAQTIGALIGVWLAHFIFGLEILQLSMKDRAEFRLYFSEVVATFGLISVIALSGRRNVETTPTAVSLFITSAYWFTSSTSFANPAVTFARSLSDTFAGIHWHGAAGFVVAQIVGGLLAFALTGWLVRPK